MRVADLAEPHGQLNLSFVHELHGPGLLSVDEAMGREGGSMLSVSGWVTRGRMQQLVSISMRIRIRRNVRFGSDGDLEVCFWRQCLLPHSFELIRKIFEVFKAAVHGEAYCGRNRRAFDVVATKRHALD